VDWERNPISRPFPRAGWQPVLRTLRRRFRLVLVDNRGSGGSDLPWAPFRVADMAADVVAVLDDAGIRRAHVMGMSLGGLVAQELAAGYPDRVDGLVLVSTSPGWPFACPLPAASTVLLAASRAMPAGQPAPVQAGNAVPPGSAARGPGLVRGLISLQRARPAGPRAWVAQAAAGASYVGQPRQARIRARTLVLHGSADTVVDPLNGRLLARRIPGAQLVTFPGLGHVLCWQDPGGFAAVVSAFLRR
jgi:pimeloyl-ACP methyl ester carboxylesterase